MIRFDGTSSSFFIYYFIGWQVVERLTEEHLFRSIFSRIYGNTYALAVQDSLDEIKFSREFCIIPSLSRHGSWYDVNLCQPLST